MQVKTRELKTTHGHMMPPPLHVCSVFAIPVDAAC